MDWSPPPKIWTPPAPAIIGLSEPWETRADLDLIRLGLPHTVRQAIIAEIKRVLLNGRELTRAEALEISRFAGDPKLAMPLLTTAGSASVRLFRSGGRKLPVSIVRTANPPSVSGTSGVVTYSSLSIGEAAPSREIYLCVGHEQSGVTISSATIDLGAGDVAMTLVASPIPRLNNTSAAMFRFPAPTGASATFKITTSGGTPSNQNHAVAVYAVYNHAPGPHLADGTTSDDMDSTNPLTTGEITIPEGGAFLAVATGSTAGNEKTWTNADEDLDISPGGPQFTTAIRTAPGTVTITCVGTSNGEDGAMTWAVFRQR